MDEMPDRLNTICAFFHVTNPHHKGDKASLNSAFATLMLPHVNIGTAPTVMSVVVTGAQQYDVDPKTRYPSASHALASRRGQARVRSLVSIWHAYPPTALRGWLTVSVTPPYPFDSNNFSRRRLRVFMCCGYPTVTIYFPSHRTVLSH